MKRLLSVTFFVCSFLSLRAQDSYLVVTSGGGFTGTAVEYKIRPDGVVLKGKGVADISYDETARLKKRLAKKFFRKTRSLVKDHPEFNHPGNTYTSLTLVENGAEKKLTWGDSNHITPEDAISLYQHINDRLKKITFTPEVRK